ncbi:Hypothetical_protein [Hexamita inflata]|uniref:Hypothetical_protein n=1 Tax=Hexamita inflata TaxID=28002 RepID=A0AA86R8J9_9EUKA|nr:Hypothetical protein HINF_LOCUS57958 [Hexamita inflata]
MRLEALHIAAGTLCLRFIQSSGRQSQKQLVERRTNSVCLRRLCRVIILAKDAWHQDQLQIRFSGEISGIVLEQVTFDLWAVTIYEMEMEGLNSVVLLEISLHLKKSLYLRLKQWKNTSLARLSLTNTNNLYIILSPEAANPRTERVSTNRQARF